VVLRAVSVNRTAVWRLARGDRRVTTIEVTLDHDDDQNDISVRGGNVKIKRVLAVKLVLAALLLSAGSAHAQGSSNQRFTMITQGEGNVGTAVATGPFTGVGTFEETEEHVGLFRFAGGTLTVLGMFDEESTVFDPRTCVGRFTTSGRWVVTDGTGIFEDATGSGHLRGRVTFGTNRTAEGCGEEERFAVAVFHLAGTLNLSSRAAA
jgi:hypothetical protein